MENVLNFFDFVNEGYLNEDKKWMQKAFSKNKGKLHKKLHVAKDKTIPLTKISKKINALKKNKHKTKAQLTLQRELVAAKNAKEANK